MTVEIGLTGNIGAGKSSVARRFEARGAIVVDADALTGRALADPDVVDELRSAFGEDVAPGSSVDRQALAERAFADEASRRRLEAIIHPRVRRWARDEAAAIRRASDPPPMIVHDVPLLFETGLEHDFDAVVLVDAPLEARVARVQQRSSLTADEVRARDAAQWPAERKRHAADVVIDNDGTLEDLERLVEHAWLRLLDASAR